MNKLDRILMNYKWVGGMPPHVIRYMETESPPMAAYIEDEPPEIPQRVREFVRHDIAIRWHTRWVKQDIEVFKGIVGDYLFMRVEWAKLVKVVDETQKGLLLAIWVEDKTHVDKLEKFINLLPY